MQNEPINQQNYNAPLIRELNQMEEIPYVPTADNPPWSSWKAAVFLIISLLLIVFLPVVFLIPYIVLHFKDYPNPQDALTILPVTPTAILIQILSVIPAHILTLLIAWKIVTANGKYTFRQTLGWDIKSLKWWNYLIILGGIIIFAAPILYFFPSEKTELEKIIESSQTALYVVAFLAAFTAPLVEEVVYRGVLYSAFQRSFGVTRAVIIVSFIFALIHVPEYIQSPTTILIIAALSVTLTLIRAKTKNLLPCIIFHTIFNGIQSVMLVLSTFLPKDAAILTSDHHFGMVINFFR